MSDLESVSTSALRETISTYDLGAQIYKRNSQDVNMSKYMDAFLAQLTDSTGPVLDNGCGTGRDLYQFFRRGVPAVGLDLSMSMLSECTPSPITFRVQADLRYLPFASKSFSGVWQCASLLHLEPEDARLALLEVQRVLKVNGILFLSTAAGTGSKWLSGNLGGRRWFHYYTKDDMLEMAEHAGLKIKWIEEAAGVKNGTWINLLAERA